MASLTVLEIADVDAVDPRDARAWDRLAVAAGRPVCLSAWMLAAQRHVTPEHPARILLARDGDETVGVAAFHTVRWSGPLWADELRFLGSAMSQRQDVLAAPGREREVAAALAAHLAAGDRPPSLVGMEWIDRASPWPDLLRDAWPGRAVLRTNGMQHAPSVALGDDPDAWLAGQSKNFRDTLRRKAKAVGKRGGVVRRAEDPARVHADLRGMFAAHHRRFAAMDRASALDATRQAAVADAAVALLEAGHLRLWVVEHDGEVVGGQLHLHAGDELYYWNGGIDPDWERESLGLVLLHAALRDGIAVGARRFDLGPGAFGYKLRFADGDAPLVGRSLYPLDRRWPLVRARLARKHATIGARRRFDDLPEPAQARIRRLTRR